MIMMWGWKNWLIFYLIKGRYVIEKLEKPAKMGCTGCNDFMVPPRRTKVRLKFNDKSSSAKQNEQASEGLEDATYVTDLDERIAIKVISEGIPSRSRKHSISTYLDSDFLSILLHGPASEEALLREISFARMVSKDLHKCFG